jgi:hypothetical protein
MTRVLLFPCLLLVACDTSVVAQAEPVHEKTSLACSAVAGTTVSARDYRSGRDNPTYTVETSEPGDRVAIRFHGDGKFMDIMTAVSVESGSARPETFDVIDKSPSTLVAIDKDGVAEGKLESFTINLDTGIAIWTKVRGHGILSMDLPDQFTTLLSCR